MQNEEPNMSITRVRHKFLAFRLVILVLMVVLMTLHIRSVRVFRWEQAVSGGLIITYSVAVLGLAICAGAEKSGGMILQMYLSGTGTILLAINAISIWRHWTQADDLTRVVADLLFSLGVPLERHVKIKAAVSAAASVALLIDLILTCIIVT